MPVIDCRYCDTQHGDLLLCPPAKRVLDALYAQGMNFDLPNIEFPEPVRGPGIIGSDATLVVQLVVKAATVEVLGVPRPALILTGQDANRRPLPEWLYPGSPEEIRRAARLVTDVADMAVRRARTGRSRG